MQKTGYPSTQYPRREVPSLFQKLSAKIKILYGPRFLRLAAVLLGCIALLALALLFPDDRLRLRGDMLWNAFLAFLPLLFAALLYRRVRLGLRGVPSICLGLLWLLFFPNAPYMLTDLIHLDHYTYWANGHFVPSLLAWLGLAHITLAVATGCLCGFLSLYLLHSLVRLGGNAKGWLFCGSAALLAGVGIYVGRFLRFNSWDLFHNPFGVLASLFALPWWHTLLLCLLFGGILFGGYCLFYACYDVPAEHITNQAKPPDV